MSTLKVGTIQDHQNSTTAMTIDNAGRILQPAKPAFSVRVGATTTGKDFSSGPQALDEYTLIEFNIGNHLVLNSGNAKFTCPVTGIYHFSYMIQLGGVEGAGHVSGYLITDSTFSGAHNAYYRDINDPQGGGYVTLTASALLQLNANQTIETGIYSNVDSSVQVRQGTRFMGYLVS